MPFQLSPGVNVSEIDLTTIIPAVASTDGAFAGIFQWGPVDEITLTNNQETLVDIFGNPNTTVAEHWFTASNFLDYGNKLHIVRVVNDSATAAGAANNAVSSPQAARRILVKNDQDYDEQVESGFHTDFGKWVARYPGDLGNNLKVSICDSIPGQFSNVVVRETANTVAGSKYIYVHSNTNFTVGDVISFRSSVAADIAATDATVESSDTVPAGEFTIKSIPPTITAGAAWTDVGGGARQLLLNKAVGSQANNVAVDRKWEFYNNFDQKPGTSTFAAARNSANDEIHIVVADETGVITGVAGQVLETYPNVSKASDAKTDDGSSNYYKDVINQNSGWIRWINAPDDASTVDVDPTADASIQDREWGNTAFYAGVAGGAIESFQGLAGAIRTTAAGAAGVRQWLPDTNSLSGGKDGTITNAYRMLGYDKFNDSDSTDISLVLAGPADGTLATYIIENVAEKRKDCVAFISPEKADVVGTGTASSKLNAVKDFRLGESGPSGTTDGINSKSSSYGVMDSGYKYQYDKFNDTYRWVPLNADVAGLCVKTDGERDPWFSPAGFNRGHVKNVVKLAWNPEKAHRDELYKNNINPVITYPGQGTVLFGDKTLLNKPSAFDRINVRRLFIVLEKAIATAAKFMLFEFNDAFTRSQFRNMVEPFLRDVQGRKGIHDFRVVCDETNNTGEVIDRHEFIGDIYIKPARSINFIQLNFVAVRTGVAFEEVVGQF